MNRNPSRLTTSKVMLFACVTHSDDGRARRLRTEPDEIVSNCMGTADRHDHDSLCSEISPMATG